MLKLPYKTAPGKAETVTVGNEITGQLEIPKFGDLSPNERLFIKSQNIPDLRKMGVNLARETAAKSGVPILEVYSALTNGDAQRLGEYLEDFIHFQEQMECISRQKTIVMATAVIKMRLCPEWTIEASEDPQQIHPQLLNEVAEFARREESGWDDSPQVELTEEDLGNSANQKSQTGEKSIGESSDTGAMTLALVVNDSDSNQPG